MATLDQFGGGIQPTTDDRDDDPDPPTRPNWTPAADSDGQDRCQNCDSRVTKQFARVFGDDNDVAHACDDCATYREIQEGKAANAGAWA